MPTSYFLYYPVITTIKTFCSEVAKKWHVVLISKNRTTRVEQWRSWIIRNNGLARWNPSPPFLHPLTLYKTSSAKTLVEKSLLIAHRTAWSSNLRKLQMNFLSDFWNFVFFLFVFTISVMEGLWAMITKREDSSGFKVLRKQEIKNPTQLNFAGENSFFPIFDLGFFFTHIERYYKILLHLIWAPWFSLVTCLAFVVFVARKRILILISRLNNGATLKAWPLVGFLVTDYSVFWK